MKFNPFKGYIRWRHSKGYGIHSPYAFRLICDVVNPGNYGYYAYEKGQLELNKGRYGLTNASRKALFFLIRLSVFLKSKRLIVCGDRSPIAEIAAKALNLKYIFTINLKNSDISETDLIIITTPVTSESVYLDINLNIAPVLALYPSSEIRRILEKPVGRGLLLNWKDKILLIPRKEMMYVSYAV